MIYVRTCAYNAEKTLRKSIESILNQTYGNFEYHILDNGSTDGTGKLVREYAKQDSRIVPYYNHVNRDFTENPNFWNLSKEIPEGSYFSILDADDTYELTFFEDMIKFMTENSLDIAACGSVFFSGRTGDIMGNSTVLENIILNTPEKWEYLFPYAYWNMRQVWGKLYSAKAAAARYETELPDWYPAYGGDTINVFTCIKAVKNFGIRAKSLHNYIISSESVSYKWNPERIRDDVVLYEKALEFLEEICGGISEINRNFLYGVYWSAIHDTLYVLNHSQVSLGEQLKNVREIMADPVTQQMFVANMEIGDITEKNKEDFRRSITVWLEECRKKYKREYIPDLEGIYAALNPDFSTFITKEQLPWYLDKMPGVIRNIALYEYEAALENLMNMEPGSDGQDIHIICLVQMLSAVLQNQEIYVSYSKRLIKILIETGDPEQAEMELAEWEQILPEDEEVIELREILEKRKG